MGKFVKKHKILCIVLTIVLVLVIGLVALVSNAMKKAQEMFSKMSSSETAVVETRDLFSSIPVNGTVVSIKTKEVKAEVTGVKITDVFVEIGDSVEEGQLLCTLDSSSVQENLDIAQKNQQANNQSNSLNLSSAQRQLADAQEAKNYGLTQSSDQLKELEKNKNNAEEELKKATNNYNGAVDRRKSIENTINNAKNRIKEIDERLVAIAIEYDGLIHPAPTAAPVPTASAAPETTPVPTQAPEATQAPAPTQAPEATPAPEAEATAAPTEAPVTNENPENEESAMDQEDPIALRRQALEAEAYALSTEKNALEASIQGWQAELAMAKQEEQANYEVYLARVNALESAKNTYDSAVKAGNHTAKSYESQLAGARDHLTGIQTSAAVSDLTSNQQIKSLKDQINSCNVYAPISGMITSLHVEKGDNYMGTSIATIEDVAGYEVAANIDEYNIGKVKEGMEVMIKTNATGDLQIKGTVKKIDPRATAVPGDGNVYYGVRISIDEKVEGLRLDMTAKMSIVLEKAEHALTVPYDAIQTEDDDKKYVEIDTGEKDEKGMKKTKKVYVTTGMETDYYVEILSGDLKENDKVVIPREEFTAFDLNALLEEEGALGGY